VDDDEIMREGERAARARAGRNARSRGASNGPLALANIWPESCPDVIVLGDVMPEMEGFEFLVERCVAPEWPRHSGCLVMTEQDGAPRDQKRP